MFGWVGRWTFAASSVTACCLTTAAAAPASTETACTALNVCYCIDPDNKNDIAANIVRIRQKIAAEKAKGHAIGYISIPLSPVGGGNFDVNREISKRTKDDVEDRLGSQSVWMLDPAAEGDLPSGASGADYMYMWTTILEGKRGLGEDFDFVYFVGPQDFSRFFKLTGKSDLATIDSFFDDRASSNSTFKQAIDKGEVTKVGFRNYYGLRASVSFSYGSHDEWNIARLLNERRRGAADFGIANQLAVLFDGRGASPSDFEIPVAAGDSGRCIK
jgi:hypothetical protein